MLSVEFDAYYNVSRLPQMALANDILARIRQDFSGGDRILRCILFVARGRFDALADAVALARRDPRDLIVNAEYDGHFGAQQRDLSSSFTA